MNRRTFLATSIAVPGMLSLSGCLSDASFSYSPPSPTVGQDVVFDGSESRGDLYWFFETEPGGFLYLERADKRGEMVTHRFNEPGTHTVTLAAKSGPGQSASEEAQAIYVEEASETRNQTQAPEGSIDEEFEEFGILLKGDRTDISINESAIIEFSAINYIGGAPVTIQLVLQTPSNMSISHSAFVDSGQGMFTAVNQLEPGETNGMRIEVVPQRTGRFEITGLAVCKIGDSDSDPITRSTTIPVIVSSS